MRDLSEVSIIRPLIPLMRAPPSSSNYHPKAPPPNTEECGFQCVIHRCQLMKTHIKMYITESSENSTEFKYWPLSNFKSTVTKQWCAGAGSL